MNLRSSLSIPKSILCLKGYSWATFIADLIAGLTVGFVALPLAMAFAISSGVPPQSGIYCAIVAGFLISALGGSKTQIGGPTGAFVVVVSGIVAKYGIEGLFTCTIMAGGTLMVLGLTGLGTAVKYIPRPVVIGFTNGIAVLIASTQLKSFFGLQIDKVPGDFIGRIDAIVAHFGTYSLPSTLLATGSLLLIVACKKVIPKFPGTIGALFVGTLTAGVFSLPVETIQSQFGGIPQGLPHIVIPSFRFDLMVSLLSPTITVVMLGAIESLLSAVVADRMSGDKHNPNVELFAQGAANIFSPLFGGLPATGAIARTATNIRSGAKTPVAGMIHALTLLSIVLFAAPLAGRVPLPVLAAILLIVSYTMGEWREIRAILRLSYSSISVWFVTFALTVFADLTVAVEAGMAMAVLLYIRKVTKSTRVERITPDVVKASVAHSLHLNPLPEGVAMFGIHGPFLFGGSEKLSVVYDAFDSLPKVVIIRLRNMNAIDATGLHALEALAEALKQSGRIMLICGMREQPADMFERAEFRGVIGPENICVSLQDAVRRSREILTK